MNPKTKKILVYLAVFNYFYWQLIYPFLKLFRFEKSFNEIFWFKSFENFYNNKGAFGISSSSSLNNKDKLSLKGDPLYSLLKVKYLFPLNKAKTVLPWTDKNKNFLDFYYKTADQRWNTVKGSQINQTRRTVKTWIKKWDGWNYWSPKVRARKNRLFKKYHKPKTKKPSIYDLVTHNLTLSDNYNSKQLELNKDIPKPKTISKVFKKRKNKYKWSGNVDFLARKNGIQMQLEHIARNRRLTENVTDRDFLLESFPTNYKHPIAINKSLSDYPYKFFFKEMGPIRPIMGLVGWDRRATRGGDWQYYRSSAAKKVSKPLVKRHQERYKKFLKKRKWYITLNEHFKSYTLAKTAERKKKILKKWEKRGRKNFRWKKILKKWENSKQKELLCPLPYKNAEKRAKKFENFFRKIVYCKPQREMGFFSKIRIKSFNNNSIEYNNWYNEEKELNFVEQDKLEEQKFKMNKVRAVLKAIEQNYYIDQSTFDALLNKVKNDLQKSSGKWNKLDANKEYDDYLLAYNEFLIGKNTSEVFSYEKSEIGFWDLPNTVEEDKSIIIDITDVKEEFFDNVEKSYWVKKSHKNWWHSSFHKTPKINPTVLKFFYNRKRPRTNKRIIAQKVALKSSSRALRAPKLGQNFLNKNFIELRQDQKAHAIRETKFFKKFLKSKYERNKKYQDRIKKWHLPPKYSNFGNSLDNKAATILSEGYIKKIINTLSKFIFNKIDIYLWHFQVVNRFWHILESIFGIDTKHTIFFTLTKNKLLTNYWCWWIKISLKLLSNNQQVMSYWYKESEKYSINFSDKYLNYIRGNKKIAFNYINFDNINIIIIKFTAKTFILIMTFLSFLYNFLFFWLQNAILINISKIFEILSYFTH